MASQPHVYGVIKNTKLKPKEHVDELVNLDGQNSSKAKDRNSRIIPNKRMCSIWSHQRASGLELFNPPNWRICGSDSPIALAFILLSCCQDKVSASSCFFTDLISPVINKSHLSGLRIWVSHDVQEHNELSTHNHTWNHKKDKFWWWSTTLHIFWKGTLNSSSCPTAHFWIHRYWTVKCLCSWNRIICL